MVKIIDVTEERERIKEQTKLEWELAIKCFKRNKVYRGDKTILVHLNMSASKPVMFKSAGKPKMTIYDRKVRSEAEMFARRYEEQFMGESNSDEFVIHENYSK